MILVMCIGNEMNGDDGVGIYVYRIFPRIHGFNVINCETVPENFIHLSRGADKVIIIDAVDMGLEAGEIRIIPPNKIKGYHFSTHSLPLSLIVDFIKTFTEDVILIGIQPKKLYGEMSEEVKTAGKKVTELIVNDRIDEIEVL